DLKQIKGIGPKIEGLLHELKITKFAQIAKWSDKDVAKYDDLIKGPTRIATDNWIEQAKTLAAGGNTEFSARVKKGDVY
ncbi:MAG: hypothetical protein ABI459_07365, partial [Deltaproteobacteria bacterium]